jgi:hypothetical protein
MQAVLWSVGIGLVAITPGAWAQDRPKADDLFEKYIEATGGKEAHEKVKTQVSQGTMEIPAAGINGKVSIYQAAPNKIYLEADLAGVGKIEEGTDGQVAWERNPVAGPRIKKGDERASALRNAQLHEELNWRQNYKKVECVGQDMVEGKPAWKVEATTPEGRERTLFFDQKSNLIVKTIAKEVTQMGPVTVEALIGDYKKVGDVLLPHKIRQKVLSNEIAISFDKIEQNVDIPAKRFDLPEEVKKLAESEKK